MPRTTENCSPRVALSAVQQADGWHVRSEQLAHTACPNARLPDSRGAPSEPAKIETRRPIPAALDVVAWTMSQSLVEPSRTTSLLLRFILVVFEYGTFERLHERMLITSLTLLPRELASSWQYTQLERRQKSDFFFNY
jgi:hypothetical protein